MWPQLEQVLVQTASEECFLMCSIPPLGYTHCREANQVRHRFRSKWGVFAFWKRKDKPTYHPTRLGRKVWGLTSSASKRRQGSSVDIPYHNSQSAPFPCFSLLPKKQTIFRTMYLRIYLPPRAPSRKHNTVQCLPSYEAQLPRCLQINVSTDNWVDEINVLQIYTVLFFKSLWVFPIHLQILEP